VPIVGWLPHYRLGWIGADAIAGFTIWGLLIPEMIAFASLAGLPPQEYASLAAGMIALTREARLGRGFFSASPRSPRH
jgi:sulfate permease, SulP family